MAENETLPAVREDAERMPVALTAKDLLRQQELIHDVMRSAMKPGVDYGTIPGTGKPSLWQPGAEKLCNLFRLSPLYTVERDWLPEMQRDWQKKGRDGRVYESGTTIGFIRFTVICTLYVGSEDNKRAVAGGTGTCNNYEDKYRSRDPYTVEETILQMARKRALVNAVRTGTAASAIFSQDDELVPDPDDTGSPTGGTAKFCPRCRKPLRLRESKRGPFWGCTGYPACRYTEDAAHDDEASDSGQPDADELPTFPEGYGPDTVLRVMNPKTKAKHADVPVREWPQDYLADMAEKAAKRFWVQLAEAEIARRKAAGDWLAPANPPDAGQSGGTYTGAGSVPAPAPDEDNPNAPSEAQEDGDGGGVPPTTAATESAENAHAAPEACPKGGQHVWTTEGCGYGRYRCAKCSAPKPNPPTLF